jgi:hypothetical protein
MKPYHIAIDTSCHERHEHLWVQPCAPVCGPRHFHLLFCDVGVGEVELPGELQGATVIVNDGGEVVVLITYGELEL